MSSVSGTKRSSAPTGKPSRLRWVWPLLYIVSPVVPLLLFLRGSWYTIGDLWTVAMIFGIFGYIYLLNQFITSSRPRFLDRMYGLPKILRFHGMMAMVGIACIVVHRFIRRNIFAVEKTIQVRFGMIALILFVLVVVVTLLLMLGVLARRLAAIGALQRWVRRRLKLQYHHFRLMHNLTAVATLLALLHVLLASSTRLHWSNTVVMSAWYAMAMGCYVRHKLLRPRTNRRRPLVVTAVEHETPTVTTLRLRPTATLDYYSGQFAYFRFADGFPGREEHPYTISSAPPRSENGQHNGQHNRQNNGQAPSELAITAKHSGDFSARLAEVAVGAQMFLDGPYGRFSYLHSPPNAVLYFVAGGIGITPFLSMLANMQQQREGRPTHLLWAAEKQADMIRFQQLQDLERELPNFRFTPILRDEPAWPGRNGMVSEPLLREVIAADAADNQATIIARSHWYVCGPPSMMRAVQRHLQSIGVARGSIFSENFGN